MTTDNGKVDETKAFLFDALTGLGGLLGMGYVGHEMGVFARAPGNLPYLFIFSGLLLGGFSVVVMETDRFRTLFETSVLGVVSATVMMCLIAGIVWLLAQAGPSRAIYTVLGVITAALVTRTYLFVQRSADFERLSET